MPDQPPIPATPTTDPALAQLHLHAVVDRRSDTAAPALWHLVCAWVAEPPRQPPPRRSVPRGRATRPREEPYETSCGDDELGEGPLLSHRGAAMVSRPCPQTGGGRELPGYLAEDLHPSGGAGTPVRDEAEWIRHVPTDPHQNGVLGEVGSFETHSPTSSPPLVLLDDRGSAYLKSCRSKMRDSIPQGSARAGPGEWLLRTKVWHHCFSKELHGAHHFVVRHAPKGKIASKVCNPFLL